MATITALKDCKFLTIDRKTFNTSIKTKSDKLMNRELHYVKQI